MNCANCGCKIEGFGSITSYCGIQWYHEKEGEPIYNKKRGQLTEKNKCFCGCDNPVPEKQEARK